MRSIILSCEHGGYEIPSDYDKYFRSHGNLLLSHKGWDPGALELANGLKNSLNIPLYQHTISRLLVEMNRTLEHPKLFSCLSESFSALEKQDIINKYYLPYRKKLEKAISHKLNNGEEVIHISVHSFIPNLNGEERVAEVGILFDPDRKLEYDYAEKWKKVISQNKPDWRVLYNYPYLGVDDGLVSYFRSIFSSNYAGIELEVNSKLFKEAKLTELSKALIPVM